MEAAVYWLHLPTHDNVLQDGYVGVSKTPTERMCKHLSAAKEAKHENPHLLNAIVKSGNTIVQDVIAVGSEEYCYEIEAKLRPQWEIGWNIIPGGRSPPSLSDRVWINDGKNHKRIRGCDRENYPDWVDGRVNVFSEEEKTKRKKRMSGKGNPFYGHKHDKETKEKYQKYGHLSDGMDYLLTELFKSYYMRFRNE